MLLLLFLLFTPASVRSDWASNIEAASNPDDLIEKGILFNEVSEILLTEKFIRVDFLVPFPTYEFTMKPDIEKMIQQLSLMWETPSLFCPLNFSSQFATNASGFNVHWMLHQIDNEISAAQLYLALIRNQLLFANQQLNFNFDTVSSLLSMIHASVKSYRSALFAFRMNVLNSIPVLLKGHLPMSLIPMESPMAIMDSVSLRQSKAEDRLTLAIPASDLLSYYDSRLLADALTVSEGLLLTLNIPLASQQTVFTLFGAKLIPMPFPDDPQTALSWNIEAPYLALSENKLESSVLSEEQFEHCLGSSRCRICFEAFPTQIGHPSCIATLYFFSPIDALAVCETTAITLPSIEQATNLGFGIWLITSAIADFTFRESSSLATSTSSRSFVGCHICIITLDCGMQIHTGVSS